MSSANDLAWYPNPLGDAIFKDLDELGGATWLHMLSLNVVQQHVASHSNGNPGYVPGESERGHEVVVPCSSRWNSCENFAVEEKL